MAIKMATSTTTTVVEPTPATEPIAPPPKVHQHIRDQPMTWSNWYLHIDWFKMTLLVFIPLLGVYGAYRTPLQRPTLIFSVLLHLWAGIGITAGYHRLWSHRAFTATLPLQVFLGFGGASALEGSIRFWCWGHRAHHRFTDTEKDPYTVHKGRKLLSSAIDLYPLSSEFAAAPGSLRRTSVFLISVVAFDEIAPATTILPKPN